MKLLAIMLILPTGHPGGPAYQSEKTFEDYWACDSQITEVQTVVRRDWWPDAKVICVQSFAPATSPRPRARPHALAPATSPRPRPRPTE